MNTHLPLIGHAHLPFLVVSKVNHKLHLLASLCWLQSSFSSFATLVFKLDVSIGSGRFPHWKRPKSANYKSCKALGLMYNKADNAEKKATKEINQFQIDPKFPDLISRK
jgi:hypothetical protein